jgi:hypothetical protein
VHLVYIAVTAVAALANGYAAALSLAGAEYVKLIADRVVVSQRWMLPFGVLLAAGALGLVVGFAVPVIGLAAAIGLIGYFVGAIGAHVRAGDRGLGGALFFLALALGALASHLAYRGDW